MVCGRCRYPCARVDCASASSSRSTSTFTTSAKTRTYGGASTLPAGRRCSMPSAYQRAATSRRSSGATGRAPSSCGTWSTRCAGRIAAAAARADTGQNWKSGRNALSTVYTGHQGTVYCLQFDDEKLVTGSTDSVIKMWNHSGTRRPSPGCSSAPGLTLALQGVCTRTLTGHDARIRCLRFTDTHLASGSVVCAVLRAVLPV